MHVCLSLSNCGCSDKAPNSATRLAPQEGQSPRPLDENAEWYLPLRWGQRMRAKPRSKMPPATHLTGASFTGRTCEASRT